jgi:hypothetical protein
VSFVGNIIIIAVTLVLSYLDDHLILVRRAHRLGTTPPRLFDYRAHNGMLSRGWQARKRDPSLWLVALLGGGIGLAGVELGYYGVAFALCTVLGAVTGRLRGRADRRSQQKTGPTEP